MTQPAADNPLLSLQTYAPPPFDAIDAEHVEPGIRALLEALQGAAAFLLVEMREAGAGPPEL